MRKGVKIKEKKIELGLESIGSYDSIFIRRGDKLCKESTFFETSKYIDLLLEKNQNCKTVFLQTDDYNCYLDLETHIKDRGLNIHIITLCHPEIKGMVIFDKELHVDLHNCVIKGNLLNESYLNQVKLDLEKFKSVDKMNPEEIYNHTVEMLIVVDIVLNSKYCILDNQSNVSRFISIAHHDNSNLFDIRYPNENIQMHWTICPAYW
jgi:hypothetical protein